MNNDERLNDDVLDDALMKEFCAYLNIHWDWPGKYFALPRGQVKDTLRALPKADAGKGVKVGPLTVRRLAHDGWDLVGTLEWEVKPGFHVLVRVDRQGTLLGWGEQRNEKKKRRA